MRTVDWTAPRTPATGVAEAEGLRERKKRLMRQQLSDTATQMFMERGFDAVRVVEIAEACGVSEKTVFNYFPIKESLILDRLESTMASLKSGLTQPGAEPAEAAHSSTKLSTANAVFEWPTDRHHCTRTGAVVVCRSTRRLAMP